MAHSIVTFGIGCAVEGEEVSDVDTVRGTTSIRQS